MREAAVVQTYNLRHRNHQIHYMQLLEYGLQIYHLLYPGTYLPYVNTAAFWCCCLVDRRAYCVYRVR